MSKLLYRRNILELAYIWWINLKKGLIEERGQEMLSYLPIADPNSLVLDIVICFLFPLRFLRLLVGFFLSRYLTSGSVPPPN